MKKREFSKRHIVIVLLIFIAILSWLLAAHWQIRAAIFRAAGSRIAKAKAASFEPEPDTDSKWFVLKHAFNTKSGTEYGYYYSADNSYLKYNSDEHMYTGRDAYCARGNGADYPDGWYYTMYLCENWYYYEFHFGNAEDYQDQYIYRDSENPPPPGNYFILCHWL